MEVLLVKGRNPSLQRNVGASQAQGEWIYFIDDDSILDRFALRCIWDMMETETVVDVLGGPSVLRPVDGVFTRAVSVAMGSVFGLGPARGRYYPSGWIRRANENELILSNLAVRRLAWEKVGGFDERLYPNEENEWLGRVQQQGLATFYHPGMLVRRAPRTTLWALAQQVFFYGMSRVRHARIRLHSQPTWVFGVWVFLMTGLGLGLVSPWSVVARALLSHAIQVYCVLVLMAAIYGGQGRGKKMAQFPRVFLWLLVIFPCIHGMYLAGHLAGLLRLDFGARRKDTAFHVPELKRFVRPSPRLLVERRKVVHQLGEQFSATGAGGALQETPT